MDVAAVILAGGSGSRVSFLGHIPKQFFKFGPFSTFQLAVSNAHKFGCCLVYVVTTSKLANIVYEQLCEIDCRNTVIVVEHHALGTCAAVRAGLIAVDNISTVIVMPADGILIGSVYQVRKALYSPCEYIKLLGIEPVGINNQFGHIVVGDRLNDELFLVKYFVEKPLLPTLLGRYLWHSGIFICNCYNMLDIIDQSGFHIPVHKLKVGSSIDLAVLQEVEKLVVMPLRKVSWLDIGTPETLAVGKDILSNFDISSN